MRPAPDRLAAVAIADREANWHKCGTFVCLPCCVLLQNFQVFAMEAIGDTNGLSPPPHNRRPCSNAMAIDKSTTHADAGRNHTPGA
jgi:hypothetical protein